MDQAGTRVLGHPNARLVLLVRTQLAPVLRCATSVQRDSRVLPHRRRVPHVYYVVKESTPPPGQLVSRVRLALTPLQWGCPNVQCASQVPFHLQGVSLVLIAMQASTVPSTRPAVAAVRRVRFRGARVNPSVILALLGLSRPQLVLVSVPRAPMTIFQSQVQRAARLAMPDGQALLQEVFVWVGERLSVLARENPTHF